MMAFGDPFGLTAPWAWSRSNCGMVRPPTPRPPILRKSRRETPSQSRCERFPQMVNMGIFSCYRLAFSPTKAAESRCGLHATERLLADRIPGQLLEQSVQFLILHPLQGQANGAAAINDRKVAVAVEQFQRRPG